MSGYDPDGPTGAVAGFLVVGVLAVILTLAIVGIVWWFA
jgi:hypothetical protein